MFNRLHASWPEDYHIGSLEKSHQIRDYLKPMQKVILPQDSNLQPMDYRSNALTLEQLRILIADYVAFFYASTLVAFGPESMQTIKH